MKEKVGSLKKVNNIKKPLSNLTKMRRGKTQTNKIRNKNGRYQQTQKKYRESSETTLRNFIPVNWKIIKKWTIF
jgi:hypothetical protein